MDLRFAFTLFLLLEVTTLQTNTFANADNKHTLCRGSNFGISSIHSSAELYEMYRAKYSNCTYVDGNLELVDLDRNYDLSFLKDIREVTGYVLIKSVMSDFLFLSNLRIIRGQLLLSQNHRSYSLFVERNYNSMGLGLKELRLTSLFEIVSGDVYFHNNLQLCHERSIAWDDILPKGSAVNFNDTLEKSRNCPSCDANCKFNGTDHCWGTGSNQCQSITRLNCSSQCSSRCLPDSPDGCCHSECAGGCTGPQSNMCLACKGFSNDGICVPSCPPRTIYDPNTFKQMPNPDFKYIHGSICLRNCPKHLYGYESACVRECASLAVDGNCVPCSENCPTRCMGVKPPEYIHSGNIESFRGCNIVLNSVSILQKTFTGDPSRNIAGLSEDDLAVFNTVTEIAGFLQIESDVGTRLEHFRNLSVIRGIETIPRSAVSVRISGTNLESLNFQSLKEIRFGSIVVRNNSRLCYADGINWKKLISFPEQMISVSNETRDICMRKNLTCSAECSADGCWGPGDDLCVACAHFRLDRRCISSCDVVSGLYESSPNECKRCHEECRARCSDSSASTCDQCRHFKDGALCVASCPDNKYADDQNICQPCHDNCEGGCTGGENTVGPDGCRLCGLVELDSEDNVTNCLDVRSTCRNGFYKKMLHNHPTKELNGKQACKRCHPDCRICNDYGLSVSSCESCVFFQQDERCVRSCPSDYYVKNGTNVCARCDSRCLYCTGPTTSECTVCKQYMVYNDPGDHSKGFNCTETCPDHVPHKEIKEIVPGEKVTVCVKDDGSSMNAATIGKIVGSVIGGVIVLSIIVIAIVVVSYKRAKAEANKVRLTAQLFGVPEAEPLVPTSVNPDVAELKSIKESELRRGAVIGSGAFGTVYKGMWIPENENVKLIVAIKVMNEGLSQAQIDERFNEVRIMASVNHQYCIRILAFCMTSQMMIVTQLMPHGCLLDFIRKHRAEIGSKVLLNWCTQIAKGMAYLEERSIVHRDLAARNILVQHPEHIRITDFGLSKLLDYNEIVVHSGEEKVPIKWMALESIQYRCFTHKSDVWSYGVTLWELFTLGNIPYGNTIPSQIPDLLEKGERLAQPPICTIDVYMLMIKCWVIDGSSRPSFSYFADAFAKMARDPGRYLVIEGDEFLRISSPIIGVKDLMRYASIDSGGAETIIGADDYLNPRGRVRSSSSQGRNDHLEMVEETAFDGTDGGSPQHNSNSSGLVSTDNGHRSAIAQRLRRNSRNRDVANMIARQQSEPGTGQNTSRYCSDPCKEAILQHHLPTDTTPPPPYSQANVGATAATAFKPDGEVKSNRSSVSSPNQVTAIPSPGAFKSPGSPREPEVPLSPRFSGEQTFANEEDDYLQPAGQHATTYVDLLDSAADEDGSGPAATLFISNPEYFEDISPNGTGGNIRTHRRSDSEESAKYYNELTPNTTRNSSSFPVSSGL